MNMVYKRKTFSIWIKGKERRFRWNEDITKKRKALKEMKSLGI